MRETHELERILDIPASETAAFSSCDLFPSQRPLFGPVPDPRPVEKRDSGTYSAHTLTVARRRKGWSQLCLARRLGVDQSTVSRLERGEMTSAPWRLVIEVCRQLDLEPQAVLSPPPGEELKPGYALALVRARISHHFLYLGYEQRLPEMLHFCLGELARVRPTVVGLHLVAFADTQARHDYAIWRHGEASFAERIESDRMTAVVRRLRQLWESAEPGVRTLRQDLAGWRPALTVDCPIAQGILSVDFAKEEDPQVHDTVAWVSHLSETFAVGLDVVEERKGGRPHGDLHSIAVRLAAIEARLLTDGHGPAV